MFNNEKELKAKIAKLEKVNKENEKLIMDLTEKIVDLDDELTFKEDQDKKRMADDKKAKKLFFDFFKKEIKKRDERIAYLEKEVENAAREAVAHEALTKIYIALTDSELDEATLKYLMTKERLKTCKQVLKYIKRITGDSDEDPVEVVSEVNRIVREVI